MKFKTKLAITFLTIILLPVLLSLVAFIMIGAVMVHTDEPSYGLGLSDYTMMSDTIDGFKRSLHNCLNKILNATSRDDEACLEDSSYLDKLNEEASEYSSYVIVRKDDGIFYAGNREAAQKI